MLYPRLAVILGQSFFISKYASCEIVESCLLRLVPALFRRFMLPTSEFLADFFFNFVPDADTFRLADAFLTIE